jgi:hypothetical protein
MDCAFQANDYYGPDAYDSARIQGRPLINNSKFSYTTRKIRKCPLPRFSTAQCGEHLAVDAPYIIDDLNSEEEEIKKLLHGPGHEMQCWQTLMNPRVVVEVFTKVCLYFYGWIGFSIMFVSAYSESFEWLIRYKVPSICCPVFFFSVLTYVG